MRDILDFMRDTTPEAAEAIMSSIEVEMGSSSAMKGFQGNKAQFKTEMKATLAKVRKGQGEVTGLGVSDALAGKGRGRISDNSLTSFTEGFSGANLDRVTRSLAGIDEAELEKPGVELRWTQRRGIFGKLEKNFDQNPQYISDLHKAQAFENAYRNSGKKG